MQVAHPQSHPFSAKTRNLRFRRAESLALYLTAGRGEAEDLQLPPLFFHWLVSHGVLRGPMSELCQSLLSYPCSRSGCQSHISPRGEEMAREPIWTPTAFSPISPCVFLPSLDSLPLLPLIPRPPLLSCTLTSCSCFLSPSSVSNNGSWSQRFPHLFEVD